MQFSAVLRAQKALRRRLPAAYRIHLPVSWRIRLNPRGQILCCRRQRFFRILPAAEQDKMIGRTIFYERKFIPVAIIWLSLRLLTGGIGGVEAALIAKPAVTDFVDHGRIAVVPHQDGCRSPV